MAEPTISEPLTKAALIVPLSLTEFISGTLKPYCWTNGKKGRAFFYVLAVLEVVCGALLSAGFIQFVVEDRGNGTAVIGVLFVTSADVIFFATEVVVSWELTKIMELMRENQDPSYKALRKEATVKSLVSSIIVVGGYSLPLLIAHLRINEQDATEHDIALVILGSLASLLSVAALLAALSIERRTMVTHVGWGRVAKLGAAPVLIGFLYGFWLIITRDGRMLLLGIAVIWPPLLSFFIIARKMEVITKGLHEEGRQGDTSPENG